MRIGEISANFEQVTGVPPSAFDKVEDNTNRTNIFIDDILRIKTSAYFGCPIEVLIKVHQVREVEVTFDHMDALLGPEEAGKIVRKRILEHDNYTSSH